jgi:hypothetical protein
VAIKGSDSHFEFFSSEGFSAPRLPAEFRISLKRRGGKTHRIELVRNPFNQRFWVRSKQSTKLPEATATEIADQIRRWLVGTTELSDQGLRGLDFLPDLPIRPDEGP